MFRIREKSIESGYIHIKVDGELNDKDLRLFREIVEKYLDAKLKISVGLIDLQHIGPEGKKFLKQISDRGVRLELADYLKLEILIAEDEQSRANPVIRPNIHKK
ncbi:MAG: hypothetical protein JXA41_13845 [Deltaproteobacteria bacterium]|nr:hypothetical protein [Deltaproteobacteria bacterium]